MIVVTSIEFNGTSITPFYSNLYVSDGQIAAQSAGSSNIDDLTNLNLTQVIQSVSGVGPFLPLAGGTLTGNTVLSSGYFWIATGANGYLILSNWTGAQIAAAPGAPAGALVLNTTTGKLNFSDGTTWHAVTSV